MKKLRLILSILLFIVAFQAAGEEYVIEKVCLGSVRHYRVDGQLGSTYTWMIDNAPVKNPVVKDFTTVDALTGMPRQGSEITLTWDRVGTFDLSVVQYSMFSCDTLEHGKVEVFDLPVAIAGKPLSICSVEEIDINTSEAINAGSIFWTTSGDGTFNDPHVLHPHYAFGEMDKTKGKVLLTLSVQGLGSGTACPAATSVLAVTLKAPPLLVTNDPPSVCFPKTIDLTLADVTKGSDPGLVFRYFSDREATHEITNAKTIDQGGVYYIEATSEANQCDVIDSVKVTFEPRRVPSFAIIPELCLNSIPPDLQPSDFYGISGKWSPSVISTSEPGTKNYTFTPDPGQCAKDTTIRVTVSTTIVPRFNPISVCQDGDAPFLPVISNNGISGTWQPAAISTDIVGKSKYHFTPDPTPGGCSVGTDLEVEITNKYRPNFNNFNTNFCLNSVAPALPLKSEEGFTGYWKPSKITTNLEGQFIYTFIPDPGQCADQSALVINVGPRMPVSFDQVLPLCMEAEKELPLQSKEGITGSWLPSSKIDTRQPGTYTYRFVPDDAACAQEYTMTVEVYEPITVDISYDPIKTYGDLTNITVSGRGGSGNYTSGVGVYSRHSGWHTFTVTDDAGCQAQGTVYVKEPQDLTVKARLIDPVLCKGGAAIVEINVSGGTKPYRYSYKGGNPSHSTLNDSTFFVSASESYYEFEVFDQANLYGSSNPLLITDPPGLLLEVTYTRPTCFGGNDATATVSATNVNGNLTYKWDDPKIQRGSTAYDLTAGTYTVIVNDDCDNPEKITVVIPEPPLISLTALGMGSTCSGSNGNIDFSFNNVPDGKYDIHYNDTAKFTGVQVTAGKAMVEAPVGSYSNIKLSLKGCTTADGISVVVKPALPQTVSASAIQPTCTAPVASIIVTDPKPNTGFQYSKDDGVTWQALSFFTNLETDTTYRIRVRKNGCVSNYAEVKINKAASIPNAPLVGTITHPSCAKSTGSVKLNGLPDGSWALTRTPGGVTINGSGPSTTVSGLLPGTYQFVVKNATGCISVASAAVVINAQPAIPIIAVEKTVAPATCGSEGSILLAFTYVPDGTYTITHSAGSFDNVLVSSGKATVSAPAGTYNDLQLSVDGCTSAKGVPATLSDLAAPAPPVAGAITAATCASPTGSIMLKGLPATGIWTLKRNPGGITSTGTGVSTTVSDLAPGTYNFTLTDEAGCTSGVSADMVIEEPADLPVIASKTIIAPVTCGSEGSILLTFTNVPNGTYSIKHRNGSFDNVTVTSGKATLSAAAGTYNDLMIEVGNCTSAPGISAIIADPLAPSAPVVGIPVHPTCTLPTGNVPISGLPASGTWTLTRMPDGNTTTGTGTSTIVSGLMPGNYTFTVTSESGCTSAASAEVIINKQPELPVIAVKGYIQPPTCRDNGRILLSFKGVPDGTYTIRYRNGSFPNVVVSSDTAAIITRAGIYSDLQITVGGCTSATGIDATLNDILAPPAPLVGAVVLPTCAMPNGTVLLSGLPEGSWTINPGNISGNTSTYKVTGLEANSIYNFTVTNDAGCVSSPATVDTHLPAPAAPSANVTQQPTCDKQTGTIQVLTPVPAEGLAFVLTGLSPAGEPVTNTTGLFENLTPGGTYAIKVMDTSTGCVSAEITRQINAIPAPPAAPVLEVSVSPSCNNPDGTVMVIRPRGTDYQYSMDGGAYQGSAIFAGLRLGEHLVKVHNVKTGCVSEEGKIMVPAIPPPPVITAKEDPAICYGGTGFIEFSITNAPAGKYTVRHDKGQFEVTIKADGTGKVVAPAGKYRNLTMEVGGCSSYNPDRPVNIEVTQPDAIVITETITPINLATHEKASIKLQVTGGNGNYSYHWENGETGDELANLDPGFYKVSVLDENGCSGEKTIEVLLPTVPHAYDDYFASLCNIIAGNVILNDIDQENDKLYISERPVVNPQHGTVALSSDGTFEYHGDPLYTGIDSFKYALFDKNKVPGIYGTVVLKISPDIDRDGVADSIDKDTDGDGILNDLDGLDDADGDGYPNYRDIDSDGDGIPDQIEAQATANYIKPAYLDVNNNGVDDAYDNFQFTRELAPVDTDKDGIPDYLDLDSDNDGVPDRIEGNDANSDGKPDHVTLGKDRDMDGLDDGFDTFFLECDPKDNIVQTNAAMQDFDGDGIPDWRDENDDNDDFLTKYEDMNGNGDFSDDDFDYDGYPEYLDYGRECDLMIPDAFSPNGDGVHDYYQIYCINHYPNAKIYIFDQLGNKLFEREHYGNLEVWHTPEAAWWDGIPDRGRGRGELVPPGTYYYVLDLGNGEVKKSFVFVSY